MREYSMALGSPARTVRSEWGLPVLIAATGIFVRLVWAQLKMSGHYATGEIANVAIAFARTGTLADAFGSGQGPTAHVMPIPPVYAGLIYRAFGIRSLSAEFVLAAISSTLVVGSFLFLFAIFRDAGMPHRARLVALAVCCFMPVNFLLEAVEFRVWEGALATFTAFGFIATMLAVGHRGSVGWGILALLTLAGAVVLFITPPLGLGCYVCAWLWCRDQFTPGKTATIAVLAALMLVSVLTPWTLRNRVMLRHDIILRSNAGLELAVGNYPGELDAPDAEAAFRARLAMIHPAVSRQAFVAMQAAGGEVAYAQRLGDQTKAWITANPFQFARLCLRHALQFLFPPAWFWNIYVDHGAGVYLKMIVQWLVSLGALIGLGAALARSARRYRYVAVLFGSNIPIYVVVQPVLRYHYLIWGLSIYLSVNVGASLYRWTRRNGPALWPGLTSADD